jgi:tetratricopeptide (TPR) repeat protein
MASTARLVLFEGQVALHRSDYAGAEKLFHEAAATAEEARDDGTAADAWTLLIPVTGRDLGRTGEARRWGRYAEAALRRAGGDVEREALRLRQLGLVISRIEGNQEEGLELAQRARSTFEALPKDERRDFHLLLCDEVISGIAFDLGRVEEALMIHRDLEAKEQRLFGQRHGGLTIARVNIGEDLATLGRADEALPWLRDALALTLERGAPEGYYRHRLAFGLRQKGDVTLALEEDRKAFAALRAEGVSAYWRSWAQYGEGLDLLALGRPREAMTVLEGAVEGRLKEAPPADLADARAALGRAKWELGEHADARAEVSQALSLIAPLASRSHAPAFTRRQAELEAWLTSHPR